MFSKQLFISAFLLCLFTWALPGQAKTTGEEKKKENEFVVPWKIVSGEFTILPFQQIWSKASDFSPALSPDGRYLIFQSDRHKKGDHRLYETYLYSKTKIHKPTKILLNALSSFEGWPHISGRDGVIFFSSINPKNFKTGKYSKEVHADLWRTRRFKNNWLEPEHLPRPINTEHAEISPCRSVNGRFLFFASDRPGGFGGLDIYMSKYKNGKWQAPTNLGANINSKKDDLLPRIHVDNESLYFSSNRPGGKGGFDVYFSKLGQAGFNKAINAGAVINSSVDEYLNSVPADPDYLLFSRGPEGREKIFWLTPIPQTIKPQRVVIYNVSASDHTFNKPLLFNLEVRDNVTKDIVFQKKYQPQNYTGYGKARYDMRGNLLITRDDYFKVNSLVVHLKAPGNYNFYAYTKRHIYLDKNLTVAKEQTAINHEHIRLRRIEARTELKDGYRLSFMKNHSMLAPKSRDYLYRLARFLNYDQQMSVEIQPLSNSKTSPSLARKRAEAIASTLQLYGLAKSQISLITEAKKNPGNSTSIRLYLHP